MEYFNFSYFILYIALTAVTIAILSGAGFLIIKDIFHDKNSALLFSASLFSGLLLFIFFSNIFSYIFNPRIAFYIITIIYLLALIYVYLRYRQYINLTTIISLARQRHIQIMAISLLTLYAIFFMNGLYDVNIFDEYYHRPIISSIASNNFPIQATGNPLELTPHYNYHYGIQLFSAALVVIGHLPNYIALDIIAGLALVGTFFLFYGLIRNFSCSPHIALASTIIGLLSGGFAFLINSNSARAAFFANQSMPFLYSGYSPIFHSLYAVTFIYIPLTVVLYTLLINTLFNLSPKTPLSKVIIVPAVLLAALALIGEVGFMIIFPALIVFLAFVFMRPSLIERKKILFSFSKLAIIFIIAGIIIIIQGGTFTGMTFGQLFQKNFTANVKNIAQNFNIPAPHIIHSNPNDQPILYFRFVKTINRIIASPNIFFGELGLFAIFFIPLSVWGIVYFFRSSSPHIYTNPYLYALIFLMIIAGLFLPTFFSSGKISDEYLTKFLFIATAIFPFLFSSLLLSKKLPFPPILRGIFILLLIISTVPNLFLKVHWNWYIKNVSNTVTDFNPKYYATIDNNILDKIAIKDPAIALASQQESWMLSDKTGLLTYHDFFETHPKIYERVVKNMRPEDLRRLNIEYVYLTPRLTNELTPEGQKNISSYFKVIAEESSKKDWRRILKLKPSLPFFIILKTYP